MNSNFGKKKKKIYTVAIIGAGRIASGFDSPKSKKILTHAHAISLNSSLSLLGITDIDEKNGNREARKWKTMYYPELEELLVQKPDIIVITTPDDTHASLLEKISQVKPRLIICEKPIAQSKQELQYLLKKVRPLNIPTLINFSRRFDPVVREVRKALQSKKYGKVISANGIYTNGILHNGSHMIDLTRFLFGELISAKGIFRVNDRSVSEPSVAGVATFEDCPQFSLMVGNEKNYAVFELEILTEQRRFRFSNFGLELIVQDVISDPLFKGFQALSKPKQIKTELIYAMKNLYTHAVEVLDRGAVPISSLGDAIATQQSCFKLLNSLPKS
jgi:predicted dehydrogenase